VQYTIRQAITDKVVVVNSSVRQFHSVLAGIAMAMVFYLLGGVAAVASSAPAPFEVIWNGPSGGCHPLPPVAAYGIKTNAKQSFNGSVITLMYASGDWPILNATLNRTACWTSHVPGCSYNPWGAITAKSNGGVPQAANLTLHGAALEADLDNQIPDKNSATIVIIDWEAWRPRAEECDDGLSSYLEYSRRLVLADPAWPNASNATATSAEAARRFNKGAKEFFTFTVNTVKRLRPNVRLGFYSQGIDQAGSHRGDQVNTDLVWLWSLVDILAPSIYPSSNVTRDALSVQQTIAGAIYSSNLVQPPAKRPAVFPYARAFFAPPGETPFTKEVLAEQIQMPAGMGVDGVILWGSSNDYHGNGCAALSKEMATVGPIVEKCIANRAACAAKKCNGNGRCVDYNNQTLERTCLDAIDGHSNATCRCSPGYGGDGCAAVLQV